MCAMNIYLSNITNMPQTTLLAPVLFEFLSNLSDLAKYFISLPNVELKYNVWPTAYDRILTTSPILFVIFCLLFFYLGDFDKKSALKG